MQKKIKHILSLILLNSTCLLSITWGHIEIYFESYYLGRKNFDEFLIKYTPIILVSAISLAIFTASFFRIRLIDHKCLTFLSFINGILFYSLDYAFTVPGLFILLFFQGFIQTLIFDITLFMVSKIFKHSHKNEQLLYNAPKTAIIMIMTFLMTYSINPSNSKINENGLFNYSTASNLPKLLNILSIYSIIISVIIYFTLRDYDFPKKAKNIIQSVAVTSSSDLSDASVFNVKNNTRKAIELEEFFINKDDPSQSLKNRQLKNIAKTNQIISNTIEKTVPEKLNNNDIENTMKNDKNKNNRIPPSLVKINLKTINEEQLRDNKEEFSFTSPKIPVMRIKTYKDDPKISEVPYTAPKSNIKFLFDENSYDINNFCHKNFEHDIDEEADKYLKEFQFIKKYVFRKSFCLIYYTSVIRNIFNLFFMNYFKNIILKSINNDHYISNINSLSFCILIIFQLFCDSHMQQSKYTRITAYLFILNTLIIYLFTYHRDKPFIVALTIFIFRISFAINLWLNNNILYGFYPLFVVMRLFKYLTSSFILSAIGAIIIVQYVDNELYSRFLWLLYVIICVYTLVIFGKKEY